MQQSFESIENNWKQIINDKTRIERRFKALQNQKFYNLKQLFEKNFENNQQFSDSLSQSIDESEVEESDEEQNQNADDPNQKIKINSIQLIFYNQNFEIKTEISKEYLRNNNYFKNSTFEPEIQLQFESFKILNKMEKQFYIILQTKDIFVDFNLQQKEQKRWAKKVENSEVNSLYQNQNSSYQSSQYSNIIYQNQSNLDILSMAGNKLKEQQQQNQQIQGHLKGRIYIQDINLIDHTQKPVYLGNQQIDHYEVLIYSLDQKHNDNLFIPIVSLHEYDLVIQEKFQNRFKDICCCESENTQKTNLKEALGVVNMKELQQNYIYKYELYQNIEKEKIKQEKENKHNYTRFMDNQEYEKITSNIQITFSMDYGKKQLKDDINSKVLSSRGENCSNQKKNIINLNDKKHQINLIHMQTPNKKSHCQSNSLKKEDIEQTEEILSEYNLNDSFLQENENQENHTQDKLVLFIKSEINIKVQNICFRLNDYELRFLSNFLDIIEIINGLYDQKNLDLSDEDMHIQNQINQDKQHILELTGNFSIDNLCLDVFPIHSYEDGNKLILDCNRTLIYIKKMSVLFKKSELEQIIINQIGLKCLRFHDIIPQLNPTLLYQDLKKLGFVDAFRIQQLKLQFQVQIDDEQQNKIQNKTIVKVDLEQIQSHLCLDILLCLLNCLQTTNSCFWVQDKGKQNDDQGDILLVDKDNSNIEEFNNLNINENNEDDDILLIDSIDDLIQNKDSSHFEKFIKYFDIEKFFNFHSQQLQKVINKNDLRQSNMQKSFQDSSSELSYISQGNLENTSDKIIKIILNVQNIEIKISENHAFQFQDSSNKLIELDLDDVEQKCDDNVSQNRYQEDQYNDYVQKDMNIKQNDQIQIEMDYFNPKDMQQQIYLEKKQKEQKKKNQQKRVIYKNNDIGQIYSIKLERLGILFTDYSGCVKNTKSDQNILMSNDSKASSDQYDSDDFTRVSIYLESLKILQEENKNIRQILSQKQKGNFLMVLDLLQLKNKNDQTVHELNLAIDDIDVCINKALINFLKNLSSKDILKTINQNISKQTKLNDQFPNFNVSTIKNDEQDIGKQENLFNDKLIKRHNKQNISSQTDSLFQFVFIKNFNIFIQIDFVIQNIVKDAKIKFPGYNLSRLEQLKSSDEIQEHIKQKLYISSMVGEFLQKLYFIRNISNIVKGFGGLFYFPFTNVQSNQGINKINVVSGFKQGLQGLSKTLSEEGQNMFQSIFGMFSFVRGGIKKTKKKISSKK